MLYHLTGFSVIIFLMLAIGVCIQGLLLLF